MARISETDSARIATLTKHLEESLQRCDCLEDAASEMVGTMYDEYADSIVLVRLFVTVPMQELPDRVQQFAKGLAGGAGVTLGPTSSVLTLFGTAGKEANWKDILASRGHVGIPLATPDFVDAIPMMSALLEQLGFDLGWIRGEPEIVARAVGRMGGTFYVGEASTATDARGRKIIAAQDFVSQYNVKTVFGFGGGYPIGGKFAVAICFLRETISEDMALQFQRLINIFKSETTYIISEKKLFRKR
jgi:hypothetical protein